MAMITPRAKLSDLVGRLALLVSEIVGCANGVLPRAAVGEAGIGLGRIVGIIDGIGDAFAVPTVGWLATVTTAGMVGAGDAVG